ncbi:alpha-(1,3)-fucosyltransferase C-like [Babylonia areolata]|uniref:alpha-(1,3)-fucosyltransferase C-like n=1 Tax=Babylonia areolata TaxID=304850 RepID=UPI003FD59E81
MGRKHQFFLVLLLFGLCVLIINAFYVFVINDHCETVKEKAAPLLRHEGVGILELSDGIGSERSKAAVESRTFEEQAAHGTASPEHTSFNVRLPPDSRYMSKAIVAAAPTSPQKKLVVIFNRPEWLFLGDPHYKKVFNTCPYSCTMTDDRRQLSVADAVWVDVDRLNDPAPPPNRPPHQMWVAYNIESPQNFEGYFYSPAWKSVFNRTFSYRIDSDFFRPYGDFELRTEPAWKNYTQIMLKKTKPVAWFVSNCETSSNREQYVSAMRKHIDIDVYGDCGQFVCPGLAEEKCFRFLNDTYYFYLAFENSFCGDYVTEKLFKTYRNLNIIPVVRGGVNYTRYLPPNTYLDAANFSSPQHLAQYLKALMKDVNTYTSMLWTKDHFYTSYTSWVRPNLKPFCQLCQTLQVSPPPTKTYPDIHEWTNKGKCWIPYDL